MTYILRAFVLGFSCGWQQPHDLTSGFTFHNHQRQRAWDYGANLGQFLKKRSIRA